MMNTATPSSFATGNTRFWTIPVTRINFEHGIDMQAVFAQIAVAYDAGEQWWLTQAEEARRARLSAGGPDARIARDAPGNGACPRGVRVQSSRGRERLKALLQREDGERVVPRESSQWRARKLSGHSLERDGARSHRARIRTERPGAPTGVHERVQNGMARALISRLRI